jgi:hypothetical protein
MYNLAAVLLCIFSAQPFTGNIYKIGVQFLVNMSERGSVGNSAQSRMLVFVQFYRMTVHWHNAQF